MKPGDALIAALRARDVIDGADARLVRWLRDRLLDAAPAADDPHADALEADALEAFTLVAATLCRVCASGSLCLPLAHDALTASLAETLELVAQDAPGATGPVPASGPAPEEAAQAAARFLAALEDAVASPASPRAPRFATLIATLIGTADAPRPLVRAHDNLYFHRFWCAARTLADAFGARAALPPPAVPPVRDAILRETLVTHRLRTADGAPLDLTDGQEAALVTALSSSVFVLAGGPGTGKTTWTAAWLRAVLRLPGTDATRVRLCAPTGRAAQRLTESLRATLAGNLDDPRDAAAASLQATTLHTLLGWLAFEGRFARGPEDPLEADWVLLDEASMADIFLLTALVRALKPGARLVLAGDPGQLPAVEAAAVLGELLPEREGAPGPVPSHTLDVAHRSRGEVIPLAAAVRRGEDDEVIRLLGPGCAAAAAADVLRAHHPSRTPEAAPPRALARIEPGENPAAALQDVLVAYAGAAFGAVLPDGGPAGPPAKAAPSPTAAGTYAMLLDRFRTATRAEEGALAHALWAIAARTRVLAPLRRGPVSAERANRILREHLAPLWRQPRDAHGPGFHGAPILITRNDARTGLSNGDLGLWLEAGDGAAVYFPRPGHADGWLRIPMALLPSCEPGFATTVHKSQGSECDEVLVILPEAGNRLLARETLYTAITRARTTVRVYGSEAAVREATRRTLRRPGGLREPLSTFE